MPRLLFIYSKLALQIKPIHSAKRTKFTISNSEAFLGLGYYDLEMLCQGFDLSLFQSKLKGFENFLELLRMLLDQSMITKSKGRLFVFTFIQSLVINLGLVTSTEIW